MLIFFGLHQLMKRKPSLYVVQGQKVEATHSWFDFFTLFTSVNKFCLHCIFEELIFFVKYYTCSISHNLQKAFQKKYLMTIMQITANIQFWYISTKANFSHNLKRTSLFIYISLIFMTCKTIFILQKSSNSSKTERKQILFTEAICKKVKIIFITYRF